MISIGLFICTLGFGRQCSHISLTMSDFLMFCRIVESFERECKRCSSSSIPFDCGHWNWNALSRSISSLREIAQTLGAGHGNQRIFSCSLHRRDCGFGKPFWIIFFCCPLNSMKAVAGTIFYDGLSNLLPAEFVVRGHALPINYSDIKFLQPDVKAEVLHAVSSSIRVQCCSSRIESEKTNAFLRWYGCSVPHA